MKIKDFAKIVGECIVEAEKLMGMSGANKKDYVVKALNAVIDIPFIPEAIEAKIIGLIVDIVVDVVNKYWGHKWLDTIE